MCSFYWSALYFNTSIYKNNNNNMSLFKAFKMLVSWTLKTWYWYDSTFQNSFLLTFNVCAFAGIVRTSLYEAPASRLPFLCAASHKMETASASASAPTSTSSFSRSISVSITIISVTYTSTTTEIAYPVILSHFFCPASCTLWVSAFSECPSDIMNWTCWQCAKMAHPNYLSKAEVVWNKE